MLRAARFAGALGSTRSWRAPPLFQVRFYYDGDDQSDSYTGTENETGTETGTENEYETETGTENEYETGTENENEFGAENENEYGDENDFGEDAMSDGGLASLPQYEFFPGDPVQEFETNQAILIIPDSDDSEYNGELERNLLHFRGNLGSELGLEPFIFPDVISSEVGLHNLYHRERATSPYFITPADLEGKPHYIIPDEEEDTRMRQADQFFLRTTIRRDEGEEANDNEFNEEDTDTTLEEDEQGRPRLAHSADYFSIVYGRHAKDQYQSRYLALSDSDLSDSPEKQTEDAWSEIIDPILEAEARSSNKALDDAPIRDDSGSSETDVNMTLPESLRSMKRRDRIRALQALGVETEVSDSDPENSLMTKASTPNNFHLLAPYESQIERIDPATGYVFGLPTELQTPREKEILRRDEEYKKIALGIKARYNKDMPVEPSLSDLDDVTGDSETDQDMRALRKNLLQRKYGKVESKFLSSDSDSGTESSAMRSSPGMEISGAESSEMESSPGMEIVETGSGTDISGAESSGTEGSRRSSRTQNSGTESSGKRRSSDREFSGTESSGMESSGTDRPIIYKQVNKSTSSLSPLSSLMLCIR